MKTRGPSPLDDCLRIARTLAGALAELPHTFRHRDLKPSNILFVGGVPKLADVGLVAVAKGVGQDRSLAGTVGFIPPEGPGTAAADLYSLGIVLYVLGTGKGHRDFPEPPADLATRPDPERWLELSALIHKACQTNSRERYRPAEALLSDLQRLRQSHSIKRRQAFQHAITWTWESLTVASVLFALFLLFQNERQRRAFLGPGVRSPREKAGTTNIAAWHACERAVALDPNFSVGWIRLSS